MSKLFRATDPLKLPQLLRMTGDGDGKETEIKAFINNTFTVPCSTSAQSAFQLAQTYKCSLDEYTAFIIRFVGLISSRVDDLCHSVCNCRNLRSDRIRSSMRDNLVKIIDIFEHSALSMNPVFLSKSSKYYIHPQEHDFLFHLVNILRYLGHPHSDNKERGLVVLCGCPFLVQPLFLLTQLISESQPPMNLYSFIPRLDHTIPSFLATNLVMIVSDPCDLEATTRTILSAIRTGSCFTHWIPSIILVQESLCNRLTNRLNQVVMGDQNQADKQNLEESSTVDNAKLVLISSGASLVNVHEGPYVTSIVYNVVPSLVDQFCLNRNFVFILPFRTAKEAVEIINHHVSNQNRKTAQNEIFSSHCDNVINLWSHDQNVVWQMSDALVMVDVNAMYINASNEDFVGNEYLRVFRSSKRFPDDNIHMVVNGNPHTQKLIQIYMSALKGQQSLKNRNLRSFQMELLKLRLDFGPKFLANVFQSYHNYTNQLLGNLINTSCDFNNSSHLKLGGLRLKPSGPVVILIDQDVCTVPTMILFIFKLIFCALLASNSIIILTYASLNKDNKLGESPFFTMIKNIQTQLTDKNLIQIYQTDLSDLIAAENLARTCCESGVIIDFKEPINTDLDMEYVVSLVHPLCMYWSTGQNIFG